MFLCVKLVEDIKDDLKLFNNTHLFEPNISEKTTLLPQQMLAEFWLTGLFLKLTVGSVLGLRFLKQGGAGNDCLNLNFRQNFP